MTTSKVKQVDFTQSFEYNNETYFQHRYEMEDGTEILANHKKQTPIAVGTEVEYEVKGNDQKTGTPKGSVKEFKSNSYGGKSFEKDTVSILYQTCLKCATELFARQPANIEIKPIDISRFAGELTRFAKSDIDSIKSGK